MASLVAASNTSRSLDVARNILRYSLSVLLIAAASLKADALMANADKSHSTLHLPVSLVYASVVVEFALGL